MIASLDKLFALLEYLPFGKINTVVEAFTECFCHSCRLGGRPGDYDYRLGYRAEEVCSVAGCSAVYCDCVRCACYLRWSSAWPYCSCWLLLYFVG